MLTLPRHPPRVKPIVYWVKRHRVTRQSSSICAAFHTDPTPACWVTRASHDVMGVTLSRDPTAAALSAFILEETGGAAEEESEEDESEVRRCRLPASKPSFLELNATRLINLDRANACRPMVGCRLTMSRPVLNLQAPMVSAISA